MTDIELSIPIDLDFTAIQFRRANASITEETAQILAAELDDIIESVRELYRAPPVFEGEEIYLFEAVWRTAVNIWPDDEAAAIEESVYVMERLTDLGGDELYLRYLRLCDSVNGDDLATEFELDMGS